MSKSTRAQGDGRGRFALEHHETDSPIIPVAQLERLNTFKPEAVDFVISQTKEEALFRRGETRRVNTLIFIERMTGQFGAILVAGGAIGGAIYSAKIGQPVLAGTIVTVALGTLCIALIKGRTGNK
jgi:hypothetical protein